MECLCEACVTICSWLSCFCNVKNVLSNLVTCGRCHKKAIEPVEEVYKIKFLDNTIVSFEKIIVEA